MKRKLDEACETVKNLKADCRQYKREISRLQDVTRELTRKLAERPHFPVPLGMPPAGHQYGIGMILLCVNLARVIGLRPTIRAVGVFFYWLGIHERIPTYQCVRNWMQRLGLDRMRNAGKKNSGVWLVDHTSQIAKEKVLAIFRVKKFKPGTRLCHEDLEVLTVKPGENWKREDVAAVYEDVAKRFGYPESIITDGASELQEPAKTLGKARKKPIVLRDPKHFFANRLESLFTKLLPYQAFTQKLSGIRSALGQTDLAHFIPPGTKVKSRFMNLGPTLVWACAVLWHLGHESSESRKGIDTNRMDEKLGWLRSFSCDICQWKQCQDIIDRGLSFLNTHGIFKGCSKRFEQYVVGIATCELSRKFLNEALVFLRSQEQKLSGKKRLPMSTEILESSFALYKGLEKQHSKNGFTSLLLAFPVLLNKTTADQIDASFARTKNADIKKWKTDNCPKSLISKRQLMFREANQTKATQKRATQIPAAA